MFMWLPNLDNLGLMFEPLDVILIEMVMDRLQVANEATLSIPR